ncbi:MAG: hypothetical protein V1926_03370 [Candidatus Peregrinibacteria bacterium]
MERTSGQRKPSESEIPLRSDGFTNKVAAFVFDHGRTLESARRAVCEGRGVSHSGFEEFCTIVETCPWIFGIQPSDERPHWRHVEPPAPLTDESVQRLRRTVLHSLEQLLQTAASFL